MSNTKWDRPLHWSARLQRMPARRLLLVVIAIGILPYLAAIVHPSTSGFSPDSWSYYDLSQTVFTDFYHVSVTRSFHEHGGYSRSFPPLWPVGIAVAERVLRLGPKTGVVLAALFALLTVIPLMTIAGACVSRRALAPVATVAMWFGLLWFPPYREEAQIGAGMPLAVFLLTGSVACLLREDVFTRSLVAAGAGLLLGLACLARLDSLVFSGIVILSCLIAPRIRIRVKIALVLTFLIAISPWVLYSQKHYGVLWASDNSAIALSASPAYAQDYQMPADTIVTHPVRWAGRIAINAVKLVLTLIYAAAIQPVLPLSLAAAGVLWWTEGRRSRLPLGQPLRKLLFLTGAALAGLAGQVLTGYMDRRYFSFVCLLAACWSVCFVLTRTSAIRTTVRLGLAFLLILSPVGILEWSRLEFGGGPQALHLSEDLRSQFLSQYQRATILADSLCYETGAVTRIHTVCLPTDWTRLSRERKLEFISAMGITDALVPAPDSGPGQFRIVPVQVDLPLRTR